MKKRPKEILNKAQEIIDEKFDELSSLENVKTLIAYKSVSAGSLIT